MPGLLNYTTEVPAERSASEIVERLRAFGASDVLLRYNGAKEVCGIAFRVNTPHGNMPFDLPADAAKAEAVLRTQYQRGRLPKAALRPGQPRRTAWRILKHWVDAQLALIEIDMATLDQVFLPYTVMKQDRTLYQMMTEGGGFQRLLESGSEAGRDGGVS